MATCADLLADLNEMISDTTNAQVLQATKIRYLNHGMKAMYPKIYKTERDSTTELVADTYEYSIPSYVGSNTLGLRVEIETAAGSERYDAASNYLIIPGLTDPVIQFHTSSLPSEVGAKIRFTAAKQLTEFVLTTDVYDGPVGTEQLPVLYALGMVASRTIDDRMDHRRYPTITGANGVTPVDMQNAATFWFGQFELLLDRRAMPLPTPWG